MGYLDNTSITVDAILTKKGRELLAKGRTKFQITQFALADDEIDYDLWNPAHPLGSDYYGVVIENMPVTEAVPDETQSMKYKLITLPKGTSAIPYIQLVSGNTEITMSVGQTYTDFNIVPQTFYNGSSDQINAASLNTTLGYTATLLDSTYITIVSDTMSNPNPTGGDAETANSVSVMGMKFRVSPSAQASRIGTAKTSKVIVTANETGGRVVVPIRIEPINLGQ